MWKAIAISGFLAASYYLYTQIKKKVRKIQVRVDHLCPLCGYGHIPSQHSFRTCPRFIHLENETSEDMYSGAKLRLRDEAGFGATGVVIYHPSPQGVDILMIQEIRNGKTLYNFPGGKRDCLLGQDICRLENSKETASSEVEEELSPLLRRENLDTVMKELSFHSVIWDPQYKAAVYLSSCKTKVQQTSGIVPSDKILSFTWFDLHTLDINLVHPFIHPVIHKLKQIL